MISKSTNPVVPANGLVLVTGVNGFIGSHIASYLLKLGFSVRGTARTADKTAWVAEAMKERHPNATFEAVVVPDLGKPGAFEAILKDVEGVVHAANDMTFGSNPNEVITPMVNTLRMLLEASEKSSTVKRFVLTSSNRAALNPVPGREVKIDNTFWNEAAIKEAWAPAPYDNRAWPVYAALKAQTEQELFKFVERENRKLIVNSVLPDFVVGPIFHPKQPGSTGKWVMDFWNNPDNTGPLRNFIPQYYTDIEDTALLHIAALTEEDVQNTRLWGFAETFNFNSWLRAFRKIDDTKGWAEDDASQGHDLSTVDTTKELELLARFGKKGWTSFDDSVRRTVLESAIAA